MLAHRGKSEPYRMMPSCRTLLLATIGIILLSPFPSDKALSEPQDKSQETPQTQPQPETQPAVPKLSTEPKPQSAPPVKPEAPAKPPTEPKPQPQTTPPVKPEPPKLSTEPKPQPQVQTAPSTKPEPPPEHETKEKEKEVHKKPLGSLILTVKLALLADARLFRYEIEVGEDEQTVTLIGRVSSEEDKTVAAEVARSVPGVKSVVNKLEVDKGLAQGLVKKQDEIITGLVKDRFAKSATLKSANFEVKTEEGVVSISGAVRFQVIALEAAEAARQVPGVKAVKTDKVRLEGES